MHRAIKAEQTIALDEIIRRVNEVADGEYEADEIGQLVFMCERFSFAYRAHQLLESDKMDPADAMELNKANPLGLSEPLKIDQGRFGPN